MKTLKKLAAVSVSCLFFASAQAVPVTLSFTADGFHGTAPISSISGSFTYDAASIASTIDSLQSVSLTIAGHTFTLGDVGFESPILILGVDIDIIFGTVNGSAMSARTNDFFLSFDRVTGRGLSFLYASESFNSIWGRLDEGTFSSFTRTTGTSIPEPTTWALAALGLVAAALGRRRAA